MASSLPCDEDLSGQRWSWARARRRWCDCDGGWPRRVEQAFGGDDRRRAERRCDRVRLVQRMP
jgi:hypothetical protein